MQPKRMGEMYLTGIWYGNIITVNNWRFCILNPYRYKTLGYNIA